MKVVKCFDLASAHEAAVWKCLELDRIRVIGTQDNELTFESDGITMEIADPFAGKRFSDLSPYKKAYHDEYARCLIEGYKEGQGFEYDYHGRLYDHPGAIDQDIQIDQIAYMIDCLSTARTSRRAVATTWSPMIDTFTKGSVPCLQFVQALIRDEKLDVSVLFRSNDMLMAAGCNMYALTAMQKTMADALGVKCGKYTHISISDHVYPVRDIGELMIFARAKGLTLPEVTVRIKGARC